MSIVPRCRVCLPGRAGSFAKGLEPIRNSASTGGPFPQDEISEVALRYVLRHPTVLTVTSGMRSVRNLERDTAVADGLLAVGPATSIPFCPECRARPVYEPKSTVQ